MAETVTVHVWSPRWSGASKSLAGHAALECPGVYCSWAPLAGGEMRSVVGGVSPNPSPSYANDFKRAGVHSEKVLLSGLDVAAIKAAWVGMAAHMADPNVQGPPIAYQLIPAGDKTSAGSCATLVIKLLVAGGADKLVPSPPTHVVTPGDVLDYARKIAAKQK
jgi:hypothetical protein